MVEEVDTEWEEWNPSKISFLNHCIAGSVAGMAEHVSMFPVDTLKTYVQCERCAATQPVYQVWNCATRIVKNEGVFRLWRGVSAMFAGCIPAHAAYFSVYENMKLQMTNYNEKQNALNAANGSTLDGGDHHPFQAALCGASASISHDSFMTPFDVVKQRMQLGHYRNIYDCIKTIVADEGMVALYRSFPLTVMMNIPYGCVMMAINESSRTALLSARRLSSGGDDDGNGGRKGRAAEVITLEVSLLSGMLAGGIAATVTTPLDVIKTRLQTQDLQPCQNITSKPSVNMVTITNPAKLSTVNALADSATTSSIKEITKRLYIEGGSRAFFRGMLPRICVHAPAVGISWSAYETAKRWLS